MSHRLACGRALTTLALALASTSGQAFAQSALPPGFVYLRDVDPSIAQDIRYAGRDNFVGRPLPGYDAAECILRREVAAGLKRVQAELAGSGLGLKVYDCYRPERAVRAMVQWASDGLPAGAQRRFFPRLQKSNLFSGYLASRSRHSTGIAVDLTLVEAAAPPAPAFDPGASYGPCIGPAAQRSPDNGVDMGTGFDCLDGNSHTRSGAIGAEQRKWRSVLLDTMTRHGFRNYFREWWHFTYGGGGAAHDFPIHPRAGAAR